MIFLMIAGTLFASIAGCSDPINAVVFADILTIFTLTDEDEQNRKIFFYSMLFLAIGAGAMIAFTTEVIFF